ncbi:Serine/threonine-protein kinase PknB [Enhygromyxa salina]|uniref:Serine/threonine-protein kinase PknB n=1 Tax=Enhygromyxa salina TaxID=215803 RepID=A0A0C2D5U2_9BACT|nr:serine/threonine-protein kinase [Enhygromyxa salina]KIG17050.1 Serine/threonine-protein kinase PknB [Enhygromyxa salina]
MTVRETAAYPPGSAPRASATPQTDAATLFAPQTQQTLVADASQETLVADRQTDSMQQTLIAGDSGGKSGPGQTLSGATRGHATVLPDVRSEGDRLIIVPRDQTRYEGDKLLGRGGMGEVKLAHDHDIGRKVAVKRLLDDTDPHAVARFIDEVRTVGSLEHPNIVPIHDVGVDEDGALFFVMKYVEGETLSSIVQKLAAGDAGYHKRYSFEARLDLFAGLLRALQYAHSQGLVHRDVKPENIMVGRYGEVVLMDWGIAHLMRTEDRAGNLAALDRASTETVDGAVVGTPQYMSPEQATGQVADLDGRSDLYSAFVVLYELLTLVPYVEAKQTAMQTVLAAEERSLASGVDHNFENPHQAAVPVELRYFLRQGLAHDKNQRYADALEAIETLELVRAGDFAVTCPVTFMKSNSTKMGRFMDRHPAGSMMFATMSALAFLGGVAGWVMWAIG